MGMSFGLQDQALILKRKFRWLFSIPTVSDKSTNALPPRKGARPGINLKEQEFQHVSETIYYPMKPDWKPVNLTLYDFRCNKNVVFDWLSKLYNPSASNNLKFGPVQLAGSAYKQPQAQLDLLDGCGNAIETWIFQNIYASNIDWGDLDMDSADIVVVDLTLRYDRAYVQTA